MTIEGGRLGCFAAQMQLGNLKPGTRGELLNPVAGKLQAQIMARRKAHREEPAGF